MNPEIHIHETSAAAPNKDEQIKEWNGRGGYNFMDNGFFQSKELWELRGTKWVQIDEYPKNVQNFGAQNNRFNQHQEKMVHLPRMPDNTVTSTAGREEANGRVASIPTENRLVQNSIQSSLHN
ncbi:hypothetical protein Bhyg_10501, partial [Pseudolycoriella hygida]